VSEREATNVRCDPLALIVSAKVGHANEVMQQIRYWIPHIRIISPDDMQLRLEAELSAYLHGGGVPANAQGPTRALARRKSPA
jgi:hypothetical protein